MKVNNIARHFAHYLLDNFDLQKEAAAHYGVSAAHITHIKKGNRAPTDRMLLDMGIERKVVVSYVKK